MDRKAIALALVVLLSCATAFWFAGQQTGFVALGGSQEKTIKIGAILPLTGGTGYIGQDMREGIDLAVEELNSRGGINNKLIEVIYEDSEGDPKLGLSAFNKLKNVQDIHLFVTTLSHVTLALAPLAEESKAPLFTIAVSPSILDAGEYTFINNFTGDQELGFLANFIFSKFKYKKLAIIAQNVEYGVQYKDILGREWQKVGGSITAVELFEKTATDYRTQLMKIRETDPDFIYIVGYAPHITRILIQARELGIEKQFFSYWGAQEKKLLQEAGNTAEGLIFPSSPFSRETAPQFFTEYEEKYGREPHYRAGLAFDIVGILAKAIKDCNADSTATECIKDKIYSTRDYPGVTGSTAVTKEGGAIKEIVMWKVENGEFMEYKG